MGVPVPTAPWTDRTTAIPPITLQTLLREFEIGAAYQRALLPKFPAIPGYDLFSFHRAAHLLTGDYFDCWPLARGRVGLLVSDASGKGISGSLLASSFRALVRNLPRDRYEKPASFLKIANQLLLRTIRRGVFISAIYAILDPARHEVVLANAGHMPMLVHRAMGNRVESYARHAPVLGILGSRAYETKIVEETVRLFPRDRLLLFTDGVNEAKAPSQADFGFSHLQARLVRDRDRDSRVMVGNIVDEVDVHRSGWEQSDDITILAARRLS